jgi:hypothetical protein
MTTENTKYISPKEALEIFKSKGIEYILYRQAKSIYNNYRQMYWEYWDSRDNVKDIIIDICTGYIKNKYVFSNSFSEYIDDEKIIVYEKKKISCANNSIEHMYVQISPIELLETYNYDNHFVNCEELLSVIAKSFVLQEKETKGR